MTINKNALDVFKSLRKGQSLSLCELLLSLRLCDNLTQVDFAKKLGIPKQHLCDIEKNRKCVSPIRAVQFAKKLGYDEEVFVALSLQDILNKEKIKMKVTVEKKAA